MAAIAPGKNRRRKKTRGAARPPLTAEIGSAPETERFLFCLCPSRCESADRPEAADIRPADRSHVHLVDAAQRENRQRGRRGERPERLRSERWGVRMAGGRVDWREKRRGRTDRRCAPKVGGAMTSGRDAKSSQSASLGAPQVGAAQMNPVGAEPPRKACISADEEQHAPPGRDRAQHRAMRGAARVVIIAIDDRGARGQRTRDEFGTGDPAPVRQKRQAERCGASAGRLERARGGC